MYFLFKEATELARNCQYLSSVKNQPNYDNVFLVYLSLLRRRSIRKIAVADGSSPLLQCSFLLHVCLNFSLCNNN